MRIIGVKTGSSQIVHKLPISVYVYIGLWMKCSVKISNFKLGIFTQHLIKTIFR